MVKTKIGNFDDDFDVNEKIRYIMRRIEEQAQDRDPVICFGDDCVKYVYNNY